MIAINILLTLIYSFLILNIISDLLEMKSNKIIGMIIGVFVFSITNLVISETTLLNTYKPLINILILYIISCFVFKQGYRKTLISTFLIYISLSILEVTLVCFFTILDFKINALTYFQSIIFSIFVCGLMILIFNLNRFKKIKKVLFDNERRVAWVILCLSIFLIFPQLIINLYEKFDSKTIIVCICFLTLIIIILTLGLIINDLSKQKISNNYNNLLNYVKTYEKELEESAKRQHEYKNQLVVIKTMINNSDIENYIDELLNERTESMYDATEINKIPIKGVKGLIYYKCAQAFEKGINVKLDVEIIERKKIKDLNGQDLMDLTQLLGIFIDNAIEAVLDLPNKDVSISIFINAANKLVISIANNFDSSINVEKILKKKHTTKGRGHGYGLMLASDIVKRNKRLKNKTEYISNVFIQNIYYDLKDL